MQVPTQTGVWEFPTVEHIPLKQKSQELEAAFLSQMLGYSGLGSQSGAFGGGLGEEQFASFLRDEQARLMVERGGIGLAEMIFDSLVALQEFQDGT